MTSTQTHGTLTDYATGEAIRPATAAELARTEAKLASDDGDNYTGAWLASDDGDNYTGAWLDDDGRAVYVNLYGAE